MVLAAAVVLGVSSAVANTTGMTFFSTRTTAARRGLSMALFSAALLGGQAVGPAVSGLLSALGSWRTAELAGAVFGALTAVALLALPGPARAPLYSSAADRMPPEGAGPPPTPAAGAQPPVHERPAERLVLYAVSFVSFFTLGAMPQTLVPLIGAAGFGLGTTTIGLALGLGGLCRFAGSIAGGMVSDRVSRKAALVPGLVVMAAGVALLAPHVWVGLWIGAIALLSLGSFGVSVSATMLADRAGPAGLGRRFGSFRLVGDTGLIAGPLAAGVIYTHVGRAAAALAVAALVALCATAAALLLEERPR